jgi:hypothetical protein
MVGAKMASKNNNSQAASSFPRVQQSRSTPSVDWTQVLSFAIHGDWLPGRCPITCECASDDTDAGCMDHVESSRTLVSPHSDKFLEDNFFDSRSNAVLFDQILATPPQLFLTFFTVHVSQAALKAMPSATKKSWGLLTSTTADAWKFWPVSMYIL